MVNSEDHELLISQAASRWAVFNNNVTSAAQVRNVHWFCTFCPVSHEVVGIHDALKSHTYSSPRNWQFAEPQPQTAIIQLQVSISNTAQQVSSVASLHVLKPCAWDSNKSDTVYLKSLEGGVFESETGLYRWIMLSDSFASRRRSLLSCFWSQSIGC